jgi:phosphate transport system substrate-binding protein
MGYLNKSVKALEVNGVAATPQSALSRQYPFSRELYMYTNGKPKGEVAKFIAFLKSAAGQSIVKKEGFVPLTPLKKGTK